MDPVSGERAGRVRDRSGDRGGRRAGDGLSALGDLRVVEIAQGVAGAFCGKLLADLGATVLKVEPPGGDPLRGYGPFPDTVPDPDQSGLFLYLNENKLGVTLEVVNEAELERLCAGADVLVESSGFSEGSHGLDLDGLRERHPSLIVTSMMPFPRGTEFAGYRAGELQIVHASGLGYETPFNQVEDPEREPPLKPFGHQALMVTGWTAALLTMAAIHHRARTGKGQRVELSAFEAVTNTTRPNYAFASHEPEDGSNRARLTQRRVWGLPWIYPCADGYVSLAVIADTHWRAIKEIMGTPEWAESELFDSARGRYQNADALRPALAAWIAEQDRESLYREGQARHIPVFPLREIGELIGDRQLKAREFFRELELPRTATRPLRFVSPGYPYKWSATPCRGHRSAPCLGADDRSVFLDAAGGLPSTTQRSAGPLPLSGVRVLDFGWVVAVPFATAWLGALGAEVVRVESMERADPARFLAIPPGFPAGVDSSPYFNNLNLSKRSIRVNLNHPGGRELVRRLVPHFDVVAENFTVGHLTGWGLGYEELRKLRPDIVLVSASPLGQTGPDASCVGWGPNTQAYSGICSVTGYEGGEPCGIGGTWPDFVAAIAIAFAVLVALHHRDRTGEGQRIDLALAELILSMIPEALLEQSLNGRAPIRRGNRDARFCPHDVFRCRGEDAWIAVSVESDAEWLALARVLGRGDWAREGRYATADQRERQAAEIGKTIESWTLDRDARVLAEELQRAGVRAVKALNTEELLRDHRSLLRHLLVAIDHPVTGLRPILGFPGRFGRFEYRCRAAPLMGADTEGVLREVLNMSAGEIRQLQNDGVTY